MGGKYQYVTDIMGDPCECVDTKGMLVPVRCNRCGAVYDLTEAKVVHRYSDCTIFVTPCCGRQVDDRTWVGDPAITRL